MQATDWVDLLVPRGGPGLIAAVQADATVPTVIDGAGNCHVYVDAAADLEKALGIVVNAKVQRPGVCNAAETLLVHEAVAEKFLGEAARALMSENVELRGDDHSRELVPEMGEATEEDWATEYLDLIMAVRVVPDIDAAIEHVRRYGTGHTEAIVTDDRVAADRFVAAIDTAVVGGERLDPIHRRRGIRVRRRDRQLDSEAPRPRANGSRVPYVRAVRALW